MSPFVTFTLRKEKQVSKTLNYAGKEPKWNQKFVFDINSQDEDMMVRVWDKDLISNDAVGYASIRVSSLIINKGVN